MKTPRTQNWKLHIPKYQNRTITNSNSFITMLHVFPIVPYDKYGFKNIILYHIAFCHRSLICMENWLKQCANNMKIAGFTFHFLTPFSYVLQFFFGTETRSPWQEILKYRNICFIHVRIYIYIHIWTDMNQKESKKRWPSWLCWCYFAKVKPGLLPAKPWVLFAPFRVPSWAAGP